jgi:4,5-DOPA dioxygenase extradiol
MADWRNKESAYDWAAETNDILKRLILKENHTELINYNTLGNGAALAIPTPEHYLPLLYILGMKEKDEPVSFFNDTVEMGSMSMTSFVAGKN